jgi:hypothetical protein
MRTTILGGGVMLLTLALGGCDCHRQGCGGPFTAAIATAGVSTAAAPVVVSIIPVSSATTVISSATAVIVEPSVIIDLRIAASTTVDLNQVTVHMLDGTNLGGPMVTVPRADLLAQFGTIRILGGSIGTFRLRPRLKWTNPPRSVAADVTVTDSRGVAHNVTAESPWP